MPLFIQIVDDFGHPDPVASLAHVIAERAKAKGVGILRTEAHVVNDIIEAVHEAIRAGEVSVQNPIMKICDTCNKAVPIWHTFADGAVRCTDCK